MHGIRDGDRFLTVREVAGRLNVCRASIYIWLKKGFPQPVKFGRASRWSELEVEEWLKTRPKGVYGEKMDDRSRRGAACCEHTTPQKAPRLSGAKTEGTRNYDTKPDDPKAAVPTYSAPIAATSPSFLEHGKIFSAEEA